MREEIKKQFLSIIVPVYNKAPYLARCLTSILRQSYPHYELLLIDDCSTDESRTICKDFAGRDGRIRYIENAVNLGAARTRNRALDTARGDYIGFVDADDWIEPSMFEDLIQAIEATESDIAVCGFCYESVSGVQHATFSTPKEQRVLEGEDCLRELVRVSPLHTRLDISLCNKLYRKNVISNHRIEDFCSEDYLFNCEVFLSAQRVVHLPKMLYHVVQAENSFSRASINERSITTLTAHQRALALIRQHRPNLVDYALARSFALLGQLSVDATKGTRLPYSKVRRLLLREAHCLNRLMRLKEYPEAKRERRRQFLDIYAPRLHDVVVYLYMRLLPKRLRKSRLV